METVDLVVIESKIAEYILAEKGEVIEVNILKYVPHNHPLAAVLSAGEINKAFGAYEYILEQERKKKANDL